MKRPNVYTAEESEGRDLNRYFPTASWRWDGVRMGGSSTNLYVSTSEVRIREEQETATKFGYILIVLIFFI